MSATSCAKSTSTTERDTFSSHSNSLVIENGRLVRVKVEGVVIRFVVGYHMAHPDLEKALLGLKVGEKIEYDGKTVFVEHIARAQDGIEKRKRAVDPKSDENDQNKSEAKSFKNAGNGSNKDQNLDRDSVENDQGEELKSWKTEMDDFREDANHMVRTCGSAVKRGEAGKAMGEMWKAVVWYRKALKICREHNAGREEESRILTNLIVVLGLMREWIDCRILCLEAIDAGLASKKVWYWLGKSEREGGVMDEAIRCMEKAVACDENDKGMKKELEHWRDMRNSKLQRDRKEFAEVYSRMLDSPLYNNAMP